MASKSVGTGPSSYENRIYKAAVSQRLRNTGPVTIPTGWFRMQRDYKQELKREGAQWLFCQNVCCQISKNSNSLHIWDQPGSTLDRQQNRTDTKVVRPFTHTHTSDKTQTSRCFSVELTAAVKLIHHVALQAKWGRRWGHTHGCGWLYIPRNTNNNKKNLKRRCWVRPTLTKRKIWTYTSLP